MFMKRKSIDIKNYNHDELYAPVSGQLIPLEEVHDEVFKNKMMGEGIAIAPKVGELYAPVNGIVTVVFPTKHVIGIESVNGMKVIIHVGIDTVELNGSGFSPVVKVGQKVEAGNLLMNFKLHKMAEDHDMTTMVVIENSQDYQLSIVQNNEVNAGDRLIQVERS